MVTIKSEKEIKILRAGGKILAGIMALLARAAKRPGATTGELENLACDLIKRAGGRPSFKGYRSRHDLKPFPTALCASINDEIVHAPALPSRRLSEGDIIGLDLGLEYPAGPGRAGLYTDMAVTAAVGRASKPALGLIEATRECLALAIAQAGPGKRLFDLGRAVEQHARKLKLAVVRDLVGHGVGYEVHEDPNVPNYVMTGNPGFNIGLKPGMVLAIEPMINAGGPEIAGGPDGFTIRTADGSLSAHFEHTVAITENGCLVLTEK